MNIILLYGVPTYRIFPPAASGTRVIGMHALIHDADCTKEAPHFAWHTNSWLNQHGVDLTKKPKGETA